jgi:PiT family inorganic phosphate transporter
MDIVLVVTVLLALTFAATNGFHDASNSIATLVATRGATPAQAVVLSGTFNMAGAVLLGTAVATTIASIVDLPADRVVPAIAAGLVGATSWNILTWWRGLPSSSGHALVGGLVGAALVDGGTAAVLWGGMDGLHPVGVIGTLVALFVSPFVGLLMGYLIMSILRLVTRRWTMAWRTPVRGGGWVAAAGLSYSHGANDAQKAMGLIAAVLVAGGVTNEFVVPLWAKLATGVALTLGTALGGWRIVRTVGRRIYPLTPLDSLSSQTASTAVIYTASVLGAPVSTTQVVASSVVGVGGGRRRWGHVRWTVVREMVLAWVMTIPAAGMLGAAVMMVWRWVAR